MSSCSSSVYSPSLGLSGKNLKEKQIDISGGVGMLPETQPNPSKEATSGAFLKIGYGFSDNVNLNFSAWTAFSNGGISSSRGYSLQSRIVFHQQEKSHFEIIPRTAVLIDGNTINGYGLEFAAVYINNINDKLFFYIGAGAAAGTQKFSKINDANQNLVYPCGFGVIGHLAFGYNILPKLRAVMEINPILELDTFDDNYVNIITPSLTIGYMLK